MTSTLVIQTSFLGDTILTTPLLSQLAHRGPVDIVVTAASAPLLANHPSVREVIIYDKRGGDKGFGGFFSLASELRARRYDSVLLAQGSWRSSALAMVAGIEQRLGFATSAGRLLYTKRVAYRDDLHHAARLLMLARPNGREPLAAELRPSLFPSRDDVRLVDEALGAGDDRRMVALAPGSVWGTKRWSYFPDLAAQLSARYRIALVGGPQDAAAAAEIRERAPEVLDTVGNLPLLASAELIRRAAVLVTNDSAPLHLASAMNTPTIAIFGPTVPEFGFGPLASKSVVIGKDALPCRPCDRHGPQVCPLGHHKCMRDVNVEEVMTAVEKILTG